MLHISSSSKAYAGVPVKNKLSKSVSGEALTERMYIIPSFGSSGSENIELLISIFSIISIIKLLTYLCMYITCRGAYGSISL